MADRYNFTRKRDAVDLRILEMWSVDGLTYRQIAREIGTTKNRVAGLIWRCRVDDSAAEGRDLRARYKRGAYAHLAEAAAE